MPLMAFGVFELDTATGELRRQGRRVHLAAQPFTVLSILAARAGTIVSRDELRHTVWGDDTFVEFDRSLNFCIATIRAALNDNARSPRFIETLPRRGYRFLADVSRDAQPPISWTTRVRRWAWAAALPILIAQSPSLHVVTRERPRRST